MISKAPIKRIFAEWIGLITKESPYYISKAMDLFYSMPYLHQKSLLEYIVAEVPNKRWEELIKDDTQYLDAIRSILIYYTGRKELNQPSQHDLVKLFAGYLKSEAFKEAEIAKSSEPVKKFAELLHEV